MGIPGAWLIEINGTRIHIVSDAQHMFQRLSDSNAKGCLLLFSHPKVNRDISNQGLPIMSSTNFTQFTHDQRNNQVDLLEDGLRILRTQKYDIVESGDVCNYVTRVNRLTRGKLL